MLIYRLRLKLLIVLLVVLCTSCSKQIELDEAKTRIKQLEAELVVVNAKTTASSVEVRSPASESFLALAGSTTSPEVMPKVEPVGQQWDYGGQEDKMSGGTIHHASVISINLVNFSSPYSGSQNGRLVLRIDPTHGKDVIFRIERGQLLCQSYQDCEVLIRFDDGKPEKFSAIGPADNSTETIFIRNYEKFLSKMRKSKVVRLSINIYQEGAPIFEFDVSGFDFSKLTGKEK